MTRRGNDTSRSEPWAPILYAAESAAARDQLDSLMRAGSVSSVADTVAAQLAELVETRNPRRDLGAEVTSEVARLLDGRPVAQYGVWAHYPWLHKLVHVLPEKEFTELRTSRNQNKISRSEQERLQRARIGVMGLSVGRASAITLAMEGIGGELALADMDVLSLSNMNRIRSRVDEIGLLKTVITAREIYEMNPYARVTLFSEGVTPANIDAFLCDPRPLDLLVEESDDLYMKVKVRERCRELGIPVIMETNDRGLLDVERFDLDRDREVLHGLLAGVAASDVQGLSTREKVPFVLRILDESMLSDRLAASLVEVKTSLKTWPQLASSVALGAGIAADVARRIVLGQLTCSGRFYVDLEELIRDGRQHLPRLARPSILPAAVAPARTQVPALPAVGARPSADDVRTLIAYATLAPSGGNCQPWRFTWDGAGVDCFLDRPRSVFDTRASYLAVGAAVENLVLAACGCGIASTVTWFPQSGDEDLVARVGLVARGGVSADPLVEQIALRVTNRRDGDRVTPSAEDIGALSAEADRLGARLTIETTPKSVRLVGDVVAAGDRIRYLCHDLFQDLVREIRWTPEEVLRTRDGVDIATLELDASDRAGLQVVSRWEVMRLVGELGGGMALEKGSRKAIEASGAVGLVSVPGASPASFAKAGRAIQRVWLRATALGYDLHPLTAITYLFGRVVGGDRSGLTDSQLRELEALRSTFRRVFPVPEGWSDTFLFRLVKSGPPSARSLRRDVESVLTFV